MRQDNEPQEFLTPKAFANSSPGLERSDYPGISKYKTAKPCKGSPTA